MDRTTLCDALHPGCPIRNVLARIGDKWSLLVIFTLDRMPSARFGELLRALPDISQKMLTVTLRTLEEDGLVVRTAYPEIPPRVEYRLTLRAESLLPHINALLAWAGEHMGEILADRRAARRKR